MAPDRTPSRWATLVGLALLTDPEMWMPGITRTLHSRTGQEKLCLAGTVSVNCAANGGILQKGPFERIWIQPPTGGALGVAPLIH